MYNFFIPTEECNWTRLLTWLAPDFQPDARIGIIVPDGIKIDIFGFKIAPVLECDILISVEGGHNHFCPSDVLEPFMQSSARKLYLFSVSWMAKSAFVKAILNVESNLLDSSILLPRGVVRRPVPQFSLLILDKTRASEGRTDIVFIDATDMDMDVLLSDKEILEKCPRVEKNFQNVILRREPLIASYHCASAKLLDVIGEKCTTLGECASLTKSPTFLRQKTGPVELSCLSPVDFAQFGYTPRPKSRERKTFTRDRINNDQILHGRDILLVAQGNVGKLCIIDPDFGELSWTGTSFTWIIRPRSLDPRVLYIYLLLPEVQRYIVLCSRWQGIFTLAVPQLNLLPVPEFSSEQQTRMIAAFDELDDIRRSITELNLRAQNIIQGFYSRPQTDSESAGDSDSSSLYLPTT